MVSVVMPAYNAARFVASAVDSILGQDEEVRELIVVDDGSTDGTLEILEEYARRSPLVQVLRQPHVGTCGALNAGIEAASGEWIAIMHADDIAAPDRIRRQLEAARLSPEVVAWGSHAYHISEDGRVLGLSRFGPVDTAEFQERWSRGDDILILHPTAFLRRDVLRRVGGYDPAFRNAEDFDLFMRMAHHGPVVALPVPLLRYRLHAQTNTMSRFFVQRENVRYIRSRRAAEIAGREFGTLEEFRETRRRRPLRVRVMERLEDAGYYAYRKAAMLYGQGRFVRSAVYLLAAIALRPRYALRKLWLQILSPSARRALRASAARV